MNSIATLNRRITLASRPVGLPRVSDFQLAYLSIPAPAADEVLVRSLYLSLDPYMRGRMDGATSASRPVSIGEVMPCGAVGFVVESNDSAIRVGDVVEGMFGWQEYAVARGRDTRRLDPTLAPISTALGALGMPGLTAYFGMLDICNPQPGETVVISSAAGAIGILAGQIAKIKGCRVVGIASADARVAWLVDELGFDAAFNDASLVDVHAALDEHCADGIDAYFDNVGGCITDAVILRINAKARIAVCGQLSEYDPDTPETGPRWLGHLVAKQAKVEGFLVASYAERFPEAREQLAAWLRVGRLKYREDVAQGLESAPQAFIEVLQGKNEGKQLVQLWEI
ncbi:MAG: NADP-dependent oxidoreductase [Thermoanaerobaculia bacterium]